MSDLDPNHVCKWRERGARERDWCRHVKVNIASADQQVERERERERQRDRETCVCVCVLFEFRQFVFFYSGNSSTYFKVLCRSLQKKKEKKSDRTRCLAVSILEYNLGPKITGSEKKKI